MGELDDRPEGTSADAQAPHPSAEQPRPPAFGRPIPLAPLERIIPWRHRIKTKLFFVTMALAVAGVAMFALGEARMSDQLLESQIAGAALFSSTIEKATTRAMLENRKADAIDTMRDVARQEGIETVRLVTKDGRVAFSSDGAGVGTIIGFDDARCKPCHVNGKAVSGTSVLSRTRLYERNDHRVLGLVTPIRNERRCFTAECHAHDPNQDVLGLLDVSLSLAPVDAKVSAFRRSSLGLTAVAVIVLSGFFFVFARFQVVRPVQALLDATRRVAGDQLDTQIQIGSRGELGLLAASFNDMTRSLRQAEGELRDLMQGLEKQVEDRTSELRKAQAALVQSEKLSSLGRLSASIAHEINNPLAGILTFAKLVIRTLEGGAPDEPTRKLLIRNLALVERETERCSAIVRNLLDFARDRPLSLVEVSLNGVVEEALQLIAHQIAIQGLTLDKRLASIPHVMADFGQLRQAVVNVALNGCQAMAKGGKLTIQSRVGPDGAAELAISDTGPGIAKDHLQHIFDPFFTTKEKGTGLGLSVVYGIVQRHRATIEVESELGKGTTFLLRIPSMSPPPEVAKVDPAPGEVKL